MCGTCGYLLLLVATHCYLWSHSPQATTNAMEQLTLRGSGAAAWVCLLASNRAACAPEAGSLRLPGRSPSGSSCSRGRA
jgi:hypothetical protein